MSESETKPKAQKRPETRMRDAAGMGLQLTPEQIDDVLSTRDDEEAIYESVKDDARVMLEHARTRRDFAREIKHLDAAQRAGVRAMIEASRPA